MRITERLVKNLLHFRSTFCTEITFLYFLTQPSLNVELNFRRHIKQATQFYWPLFERKWYNVTTESRPTLVCPKLSIQRTIQRIIKSTFIAIS